MFDLTQKEKIPTSQIGQITSTDLAAGVLVSGGYTTFINPSSTIAAGAGATALQAFVNGGGTYIGALGGRDDERPQRRHHDAEHEHGQRASARRARRSTRRGTRPTRPAGASTPAAGSTARRAATRRSTRRRSPATAATIPAATAVATYAPAGDCGGPAGFGNCYGYEVNANANLPGRPAVVDQPFGAGPRDPARLRRVVPRVDGRGRAARPERRRSSRRARRSRRRPRCGELALVKDHARSPAIAVAAANLPRVANRPVNPSGAAPLLRRLDG